MYQYQTGVPLAGEHQVVVCGGGPAGIAAAIVSGRKGVDTALIERYGFVGGMATAGLIGPLMTCYSLDGQQQVVKGIFDELVRRMETEGGAVHPSKVQAGTGYASYNYFGHHHVTPFEPEAFKSVAMEMLLEAGVKLYLHHFVVDVIKENGKLTGLIVANKAGLQVINGAYIVDATADADIAAKAGAEFVQGRESDGLTQPISLFFRIGNVDDAAVQKYAEQQPHRDVACLYEEYIAKANAEGYKIARNKVNMYRTPQPGVWRVNNIRMLNLDGTKPEDLTLAEIEGRKQLKELMRFFRHYLPGFENVVLIDAACQVGVRETRRIVGEYVLTMKDLATSRHFPDCIALGGFPVDIHSPTGTGGGLREDLRTANVYEIPLRCMFPKQIDYLIVAGRCISVTHEALGAVRVMPTALAMGQAAGTAVAIAAKTGRDVKSIDFADVRTDLLTQGVVFR